ncbi:glycoside hydrolase family 28 protein [Flavobacterium sp. F-380]|uniref:Glycoside hydrolase family 28 protein n=1 Tax=Flavobacterium kayseriense TaxID=2764714 RepID=A0ABR7J9F9_9FLAO|nr:glycoside hydrolase family 28 protein [Flavobacterium kayseriense]MBC5842087.1 glycoside hydrolase family 28 protein [Flavobacterium kayseriense]MBC5848617.1 glycoside hydrolase family 28 protein [Flavobacterium kayseriense]MBU0941292.1 glycoside hydrolase family 28 protein [Bacteroidota bacterium]
MKSIYLYLLMMFCFHSILAQQNTKLVSQEIERIVNRIKLPNIGTYTVNLKQFGARGDAITNCKPAFDKAMKACEKRQGGKIYVPKGEYLVNGPIHFKSNIELHLEEGAVIRFGSNPLDYPIVLTSWEGTMLYNYSPMIYGNNVENIAITGKGVIDGEAHDTWNKWKSLEKKDQLLSREMNHNNVAVKDRIFGQGHYLRPQLIQFINSKNILLENFKIEDAPFWCIHLLKSKSITIRGISYDVQNYNNDGIDPEYSSDILIENIKFNNADDNIAIKAGRDDEGRSALDGSSENIVIRNCEFKGLHAIVIGSEMSAGIRNVYVDNCKASGYLKRGIYIKTNSDRGGFIKDIYFSNISLGKVEDCIYMTANYHGEGSGLFPSKISDIYISNISCENASNAAIVIEGFPESKVENITLENIKIKAAKNGMTLTNTKNISLNEIIIGDQIGVPSAVK